VIQGDTGYPQLPMQPGTRLSGDAAVSRKWQPAWQRPSRHVGAVAWVVTGSDWGMGMLAQPDCRAAL